jgi:hypothetical protein
MADTPETDWKKLAERLGVITAALTILGWFGVSNWHQVESWFSSHNGGSSDARISTPTFTPPPPISKSLVASSSKSLVASSSKSLVASSSSLAPPSPPASVGDCIVVNSSGAFQGIGNCDGTRGTYEVNSVKYHGSCIDPESPYITQDGYRLCLEAHLVRNHCYVIPQGQGWVTGARECRAPGSVSVVDIVPGATDSSECTRAYQWNHSYAFHHPQVVYCVMQY